MQDHSGRVSGYGFHRDKRMKRQHNKPLIDAEDDITCDECGKKHAKHADGWRFLCIDCRKAEEAKEEYGD